MAYMQLEKRKSIEQWIKQTSHENHVEPNTGYISPQIHSPHDNHSLCISPSQHSTNVPHSPSVFKSTIEKPSMNVTSKPALPALLVRRSTMDSILLKPQRRNLSVGSHSTEPSHLLQANDSLKSRSMPSSPLKEEEINATKVTSVSLSQDCLSDKSPSRFRFSPSPESMDIHNDTHCQNKPTKIMPDQYRPASVLKLLPSRKTNVTSSQFTSTSPTENTPTDSTSSSDKEVPQVPTYQSDRNITEKDLTLISQTIGPQLPHLTSKLGLPLTEWDYACNNFKLPDTQALYILRKWHSIKDRTVGELVQALHTVGLPVVATKIQSGQLKECLQDGLSATSNKESQLSAFPHQSIGKVVTAPKKFQLRQRGFSLQAEDGTINEVIMSGRPEHRSPTLLDTKKDSFLSNPSFIVSNRGSVRLTPTNTKQMQSLTKSSTDNESLSSMDIVSDHSDSRQNDTESIHSLSTI